MEVADMATRIQSNEKPQPANKQKGQKICPCCHEEKKITDFYISKSPLYSLDGRVPLCKNCMINSSLNDNGTVNEVELNKILRQADKPYFKDDLASAVDQVVKEHSYLKEEDVGNCGKEILQIYFKNIAMRQTINLNYDDSEKCGFIHRNSNTNVSKKREIIKKYSSIIEKNDEDNTVNSSVKAEIQWTPKDIQNKEYSIDIVGYDPFEDYPDDDRRFLFNQLAPYLDDEDSADDPYKISQILQIVNNNRQIHICDKRITNLDPIKDATDIKTLNTIKKDLVTSNDKIAKENEISVKNRSNKDVGKSTLTYLMRDLRERNFDRAESDYYDQLKGEGTQWAISISQKAMLDHCLFDENDKKEVYENQVNLINQLYAELDDKKEQVRLLLSKIDKLNSLLMENGISECGDVS